MKLAFHLLGAASILLASNAFAQSPPAGTTAVCGDGSYSHAATEKGACSSHGGVKTWIGTASTLAAPAPAPADTHYPVDMIACSDGTMAQLPVKPGTCSHHGGVKKSGTPPPPATPPAPPVTPAPAAPPVHSSAPVARAPSTMPTPPMAGPGMVWVNTSSRIYHCPGSHWYGKTKVGAYMSESDAIAKGNHADHGKACH